MQIKAGEKVYRLEPQLEVMDWIARKNKRGRIYKDSRNLLNQQVRKRVAEEEEDLFLDDEAGIATTEPPAEAPATTEAPATGKAKKAKKTIDTTRLDTGINTDDE